MSAHRRSSLRTSHEPGSLKEAGSSDEDEREEGEQTGGDRPVGKRAKKEPKAPQTPETLAPLAPGSAIPTHLRRKKAAAGATPATGDMALIELLVRCPEDAVVIAKAWVARYLQDETTATAELLTLLVQAAGVSHVVSKDEVEEGDADELASRLRAMVMEDGGFEPFSNKRTAKGMKAGFPAFWGALIEELHGVERLVSPTTGNTDNFALEKVKDLAVALSLQVVRPFRLAATLCAAQLVSSVVGVRTQLLDALAQVIQQRDAEQKKGARANKATLASVQRQVDSYHRQDDSLNAWVDSLIKSVFAVRFRDVAPSIRALVISSFGQWIRVGPATFLSDAYLKYLGWALSDRDASVRSAAITGLKNLYNYPRNVHGMRDFTGRFLGRMMELPYDISDAVAAAGMELLATLVQLQEVGHAQIQDLYGLLADESPFIREAAAVLAAKMLQAEAEERAKGAAAPQAPGKGGKGGANRGIQSAGQQNRATPATDIAVLLDVMSSMQNGGRTQDAESPAATLSPQTVALLVDSLYGHFPAVRDGSVLAGALGDEGLSSSPVHAVHAAMLLAASLQRAQQGSVGGAVRGAGPRAKATAPNSVAHQDASLSLIGSLPALIRKHQTQSGVVAPLCQAVRLLRLELFALKNEERAFGDLLNLVADQVFRHTDFHVAAQAVDTLVFCCKSGPGALQPIARLALTTVASKAAQDLGAAARKVLTLSEQALQDEVEELETAAAGTAPEDAAALWRLKTSLTRVQALLSRGAWTVSSHTAKVWQSLAQLLDRCGSQGGQGLMGLHVTGQLVHAAHTAVLAGLAQLKQASEEGNAADAAAPVTATGEGAPSEGVGGSGSKRTALAGRGGRRGAKRARRGQKGGAAVARGVQDRMDEEDTGDENRAGLGHAGDGSGHICVEMVNAWANALARKLVELYDAAQDVQIIQVVVNRAMVDLLLLFGHNTWKGTPMEGCRLSVGPDFLDYCWQGCDTALRLPEDTWLSAEPTGNQDQVAGAQDEGQQINKHVRALQRRLLAVGGIARLLLSPSLLPNQKDALAIRLLAQLTSYGPEVEEMVRDIAVELRRRKHQGNGQQQQHQQLLHDPSSEGGRGLTMAELNLEALKCSYKGVLEVLSSSEAEEAEGDVDLEGLAQALSSFNETASALASMYAGVGLSRDELMALVKGGASYALAAESSDRNEAMPRLYFLAWGLGPFVPKLLPQDAAQLVGELEGLANEVAATSGVPSMGAQLDSQGLEEEEATDTEWAQYKHFMGLLKARASKAAGEKGKGRGALKGARARQAPSPAPSSHSPARDHQDLPEHGHEEVAGKQQQQQQQQERLPYLQQDDEEQLLQEEIDQPRPLQPEQQQATFGRRGAMQSSAGHVLAQQTPAYAEEEPIDTQGTLLDGSAPLSEDAQLPRVRPSQVQHLRYRREAVSGGSMRFAENDVEWTGEADSEGREGEADPLPSQAGTQTTTQTTNEPPPRAYRRRRN